MHLHRNPLLDPIEAPQRDPVEDPVPTPLDEPHTPAEPAVREPDKKPNPMAR